MYPNFNNYYPQPQQMQQMNQYCGNPLMQSQTGLKGRPVSSIEEARAAQIDFDGSLFIFPDVANRKIYTKCINMDGTSTLNTFELIETPPSASVIDTNNYVTKEELNNIIDELKKSIPQTSVNNKPQSINF